MSREGDCPSCEKFDNCPFKMAVISLASTHGIQEEDLVIRVFDCDRYVPAD